ncbi:hypothetical protein A0H81_00660 [Grifola frondosa]|uniref:Uncharacterized protein n=1 Tax=Grifola frondosa TaxID=5627 RepID=A0A1C7MQN7_GRIFR|nr:hypothetical protein A0H81_00660 [Grifola frondosa]
MGTRYAILGDIPEHLSRHELWPKNDNLGDQLAPGYKYRQGAYNPKKRDNTMLSAPDENGLTKRSRAPGGKADDHRYCSNHI